MAILDDLEARGLIANITDRAGLDQLLGSGVVPLYAGFDPTASSLHVGNLVPTMLLTRFQRAGHKPIVLVGGATGMVGDPSGKSAERNMLDMHTLAKNLAGQRAQFVKLLDFDDAKTGAVMVDNYDWTRDVTLLDFLRDIGRHITINYMTAKDSVRNRLGVEGMLAHDADGKVVFADGAVAELLGFDPVGTAYAQIVVRDGIVKTRQGKELAVDMRATAAGPVTIVHLTTQTAGISYTEFSYMLLQAFDFVHLQKTHGCRLQVGGSDQFGNITAGTELARKMGAAQLYGLTAPLLLDSTGEKMGKTSTGERVWLDPERTTPYAFYQYWLNLPDADVGRLLMTFSLRPVAELRELLAAHDADRAKRNAQRELARTLTTWVHGEAAIAPIERAARVMFGGTLDGLTDADLGALVGTMPTIDVPRAELAAGIAIADLLVRTNVDDSKGAARRRIEAGGAYVNNKRIDKQDTKITLEHLATETMIVVRGGKKEYRLVRVV